MSGPADRPPLDPRRSALDILLTALQWALALAIARWLVSY